MKCCKGHMLRLRRWNAVTTHHNVRHSMRIVSAVTFLALLAIAPAVEAATTPAPHQVDIPMENGILHAQLYKQEGNGPFPVVIGLHGCGGLAGHSEPVQPRYRDWADCSKQERPSCYRTPMVRASSGRNAMSANTRFMLAANGWPISWPQENGSCSNPGRRATASACWGGPMAPAHCCGRCVHSFRTTSSRTSAPRSRSIRTAAFHPDSDGAHAFRRCC